MASEADLPLGAHRWAADCPAVQFGQAEIGEGFNASVIVSL